MTDVPAMRATFRVRAMLIGLSAVIFIVGCESATEPRRRPPIAAADSLLIAGLAGRHAYVDSMGLTWDSPWGRGRVQFVDAGELTASVIAANGLHLERIGVDSSWMDTSSAVTFVRADSMPGIVWLVNDTLNGFWTSGPVPRRAVSDSGLHYHAEDVTVAQCDLHRSLWVPREATSVRCTLAVHWRPLE